MQYLGRTIPEIFVERIAQLKSPVITSLSQAVSILQNCEFAIQMTHFLVFTLNLRHDICVYSKKALKKFLSRLFDVQINDQIV